MGNEQEAERTEEIQNDRSQRQKLKLEIIFVIALYNQSGG
jgi:hypothetical protein